MASREIEVRLAALELELPNWTNDEVYQFFLFEAMLPDEYDGEFSNYGHGQREITEREVTRRLQEAGFITSDWEDLARLPG